jgi:hypothetical protein
MLVIAESDHQLSGAKRRAMKKVYDLWMADWREPRPRPLASSSSIAGT